MVIFDCDGVLIDSEGPSCRLIAQDARERGLAISDADAMVFAGQSLTHIRGQIEQMTGGVLPQDWVAQLQAKLVTLMARDAIAIDGAEAMVDAVVQAGFRVRVGSNSSVAEMDAKFGRVSFAGHFNDRAHSARDMGAPKPSPAVFIHAAALEGIAPERCIVLEDSDTGLAAARAAGMACVLLRPLHEPAPSWSGLHRIAHLSEFLPLIERLEAQRAS